MGADTVGRVVELLLDEPYRLGPRLEVLWHAGEPLAAGLAFYVRASEKLRALTPYTEVIQTFQTNGTLITDEWCRFFIESGAEVGVSLDGPKSIHDSQRVSRRGRGSFDMVMRGVSRLLCHNLAVSVLAVVTPVSLGRAREMFDFFLASKVSAVGFNVEETEGEHRRSLLLDSGVDLDRRFRLFLLEILERNVAAGSPLWIREIQASVQSLIARHRDPTCAPAPAETQCGRILTVARNGDLSTFSPELASGYPGNRSAFALGNIFKVECLTELLESEKTRMMQAKIDAGISLCRESCGYFGICGGGSPANKIYENGTFASSSTIKCRLQLRAVADLLLDLARVNVEI